MAFDDVLRVLRVIATATSTMDVRVQDMIILLGSEEPRIRMIEKGKVEFHFKDDVRMSVSDDTDRKVPDDLRIRAD